MNPLAITGLGICSPLGIGREAFFDGIADGKPPAPKPLESFDGVKYEDARRVLEVPSFDPTRYLGDKGLRTLDRLTKLLVVATRLAMIDAGVKRDGQYIYSSPERVGIVCSNAYGSLEAITELDRVATLEAARYINPAKFPNTVSNSAAGYASIWEDLRAINVSVSDGNCGALDACACADIFLGADRADALVVGGAEAMSEALFLAFNKIGALDDGTRIGEGAALFVIETQRAAMARGAAILAELVGYGTAFIAPEAETPLIHPSRAAMDRAIASALEDANVKATDIDVVASGLSGLRAFDDAELTALGQHFGPEVAIATPKSLVGETLGAGAAIGMAAALAWFGKRTVCPIVSGQAPKNVKTVLVTSMGFYGNASALVMRAGASENAS